MNEDSRTTNNAAWRGAAPAAWVARFGTPQQAAVELRARPRARLAGLDEHCGDVAGKRVLNLMGSNGVKAVALALLGAEVTVIDLSEGNARYASALAEAAGVALRYVVGDVLALAEDELARRYDLVLAELGIVHYFTDLAPFASVVAQVLVDGGRFVLRDFHPVATKLLSFRGSSAKVRKVKVTGDYFDTALHEEDAPFAKFLPPEVAARAGKVHWRRWTLGEVVTAFATAGLRIVRLVEEPNRSSEVFDRGIPKTFTLVAGKH
jgi:2-polyprenyl-3-methyl-5-hydroxy-6-metoxy-1,4-benzoquinol methylase